METTGRERRIASLKRFAAKNDVSERQLRHWIDAYGAPCIRVGRNIYIDEDAMWEWLDERRQGG